MRYLSNLSSLVLYIYISQSYNNEFFSYSLPCVKGNIRISFYNNLKYQNQGKSLSWKIWPYIP